MVFLLPWTSVNAGTDRGLERAETDALKMSERSHVISVEGDGFSGSISYTTRQMVDDQLAMDPLPSGIPAPMPMLVLVNERPSGSVIWRVDRSKN
jgi:hypothetical protein